MYSKILHISWKSHKEYAPIRGKELDIVDSMFRVFGPKSANLD